MVVGVASVAGAKTAEMFFLDRRTIAASPARNFLHLVVIMDWVSRAVLAWRFSNTLGAEFCVEALEKALSRYGRPEIFSKKVNFILDADIRSFFTEVSQEWVRFPGSRRGKNKHSSRSTSDWPGYAAFSAP
jgi:transposase InsO family protein